MKKILIAWTIFIIVAVVAISQTTINGARSILGKVTTYNNIATVGIGITPVNALISLTAQVATIANGTNLCAAAVCPVGQYDLDAYIDSTVVCATPGPAVVGLNLTWTDETGTKTNQVIPLDDNNALTFSATLPLGTATGYAAAHFSFFSSGANAIQYGMPYTACTTGTGTFAVRISVRQIQ